jgi:glucose-1-phosphate thymidylyltransferase
LHVERMGRGTAWLDSGTPDSLIDAASYVRALENRQGERIACPEVIALEEGYISAADLAAQGRKLGKSDYGRYLLRVADEWALSGKAWDDTTFSHALVRQPHL